MTHVHLAHAVAVLDSFHFVEGLNCRLLLQPEVCSNGWGGVSGVASLALVVQLSKATSLLPSWVQTDSWYRRVLALILR